MQSLLTSVEAAELLSVSVSRLTLWRVEGRGPAYVRLTDSPTGRIRYRPEDIAAYIEQSRVAAKTGVVDTKTAAEMLGISTHSLQRKRCRGESIFPVQRRRGSPLYWRLSDIRRLLKTDRG